MHFEGGGRREKNVFRGRLNVISFYGVSRGLMVVKRRFDVMIDELKR